MGTNDWPIFLSYRREDDGYAGRLFDYLNQRFPGQVFRDIEGIDPGEDWRHRIEIALDAAKVFIVVVGKHWEPGRLADPDDVVRYESSTALKRGISVLITLAPGGEMPRTEALPEEVSGLTQRQAVPISVREFDRDARRLLEVVEKDLRATFPVLPREKTLSALVSEFVWVSDKCGHVPSILWPFRRGWSIEGGRLAGTALVAGLIACGLSLLSHAALLSVSLTKGESFLRIYFGYLEELNAGPLYVLLVPLFVLFAFRFLRSFQSALRAFESNRRLRVISSNAVAGYDPSVSPITVISQLNRRIFGFLLVPIVVIVFGAVVVREIGPGGDYSHLAFGYVQAIHVSGYPAGKTISEFEQATGRRIRNIAGVPNNQETRWIVQNVSGGPRTLSARAAFYVFLALHLLLEWWFACLVTWFVIKAGFVLWLVLSSICPKPSHHIELELDLLDPDCAYGLGWLNRAWKCLLWISLILAVTCLCSLIANYSKGSWRPGQAVIGQAFVAIFGFILSVLLVVYMFLLYWKVEAAKDDALGRGRMVSQQKFPVDGSLVALAITSLAAYPILLIAGLTWAVPVARFWTTIIQFVTGYKM